MATIEEMIEKGALSVIGMDQPLEKFKSRTKQALGLDDPVRRILGLKPNKFMFPGTTPLKKGMQALYGVLPQVARPGISPGVGDPFQQMKAKFAGGLPEKLSGFKERMMESPVGTAVEYYGQQIPRATEAIKGQAMDAYSRAKAGLMGVPAEPLTNVQPQPVPAAVDVQSSPAESPVVGPAPAAPSVEAPAVIAPPSPATAPTTGATTEVAGPSFADARKKFLTPRERAQGLTPRQRAMAELERSGTIGGVLAPGRPEEAIRGLTGEVSPEEQKARLQTMSGNPAERSRGAATLARLATERKQAEANIEKEQLLAKRGEALQAAGLPAGAEALAPEQLAAVSKRVDTQVADSLERFKQAELTGREEIKADALRDVAGATTERVLALSRAEGKQPGTPEADALWAAQTQNLVNEGIVKTKTDGLRALQSIVSAIRRNEDVSPEEQNAQIQDAITAIAKMSEGLGEVSAPKTVGAKGLGTGAPGGEWTADDETKLTQLKNIISNPDQFRLDVTKAEDAQLIVDAKRELIELEEKEKALRRKIAEKFKPKQANG